MIDTFKKIIWDWNGTLFNDVKLSIEIMNNILLRMKLKPLSYVDYKNIFTFPIKDYYSKAGLNFNEFSFEIISREWIEQYEKRKFEGTLYEGVIEVLQFISDKGIKQSIISAYSQNMLFQIVSTFKLEHYFSYLAGLDNIYAESKIELGKEFMKNIVDKNDEVLLIGDTVHDYEVAREIGAKCLLIAGGHQSIEKLTACGVPVLNNIKEIYNY